MNKNLVHVFSRAVFFLGVIIGFALAVVMIWNEVEATHYFFDGGSYEPFRGLHCPLLLAPTETGLVTAAFQNPTDQEINFYYRAEISGSLSTRWVEDRVAVPAHQTKTIPLPVSVNDVDLLYFIFVKINVFPNTLHGSQQSVCGIRISSILGLVSSQIPVVALSMSFFAMAVGLALRQPTEKKDQQNTERVLQALGLVVLLALLAGAAGWWLPGMLLSAVAVLLMLISVRMAIA